LIASLAATPAGTANLNVSQITGTPYSNAFVANVPGFSPEAYRQDVERRIRSSLSALAPSHDLVSVKIYLSFDILPDGLVDDLQFQKFDVMPQNSFNSVQAKYISGKLSADELSEIERKSRDLIASAAPFRPVSSYPISSVRMNVELEQISRANFTTYSVFAYYAESPSIVLKQSGAKKRKGSTKFGNYH
jgi:hypothetical protein